MGQGRKRILTWTGVLWRGCESWALAFTRSSVYLFIYQQSTYMSNAADVSRIRGGTASLQSPASGNSLRAYHLHAYLAPGSSPGDTEPRALHFQDAKIIRIKGMGATER